MAQSISHVDSQLHNDRTKDDVIVWSTRRLMDRQHPWVFERESASGSTIIIQEEDNNNLNIENNEEIGESEEKVTNNQLSNLECFTNISKDDINQLEIKEGKNLDSHQWNASVKLWMATIYTLKPMIFAVLIALVLPQAHPAPPPAGGEKKIVIVGPGAGPWSVGSQLVATLCSTGFDSDQPVIVTTHTQGSTTPIFSADSTHNNGSIPIPIDDKYIPGTNYVTEVGLKSDPTIKEGGDGPAAPELGLLGTPANNPPPPDKPPTATPAPPPGKLGICTQI
ncbi:9164_t:CDS:2 [Rhizophagus irregularis]|nr:9164_t:CDS:2 [Rhizophagus irregularis]